MTRSHRKTRGYALADALLAMALFAWAAIAAASLVHGSVRMAREAERVDRARAAAETVLERLGAVSWHRLPELFAATDDAAAAVLDTSDGSAPADWRELLAGLPEGRIVARLEGIGSGAVPTAFDTSVALRVRVEVSFARSAGVRRRVRLTAVRL